MVDPEITIPNLVCQVAVQPLKLADCLHSRP